MLHSQPEKGLIFIVGGEMMPSKYVMEVTRRGPRVSTIPWPYFTTAQPWGVVRAQGAAPAQGRVPRSAPAPSGAGPRARFHPEDAAAGRLRLDLLGDLCQEGS